MHLPSFPTAVRVLVAAVFCLQIQAAEPTPISPPLTNAVLAPALKAAADNANINLSSQEVQTLSPALGDAMVFWVGTVRGPQKQQWLLQLKRSIATPAEQKSHPPVEVKKYLSWGPVVKFKSEMDALELWIAGPVTTSDGAKNLNGSTVVPAKVRSVRVFVPRDYLRLGLDDSVRAKQYMDQRIQAILKEDPKFGVGNIYSLGKPIKQENIAWAKPVAERIGFSPAMERAWMGGYVALEAFYKLANDVPELKEIADVAVDRPAAWKFAKLALGGNFKTFFGGENTQLIDPLAAGLLPVALETFQVPVFFTLEDDLMVNSFMAVTSSAPPLDVGAGILGFVAFHPKDPTRLVEFRAISASRGESKKSPQR